MAKPKKRRTAAKKRAKAGRTRVRKSTKRPAIMLATWDTLFGASEAALRSEARFRTAARGGATRGGSPREVLPPGQVEALFGISWTDPTFRVFYDIIINDSPIDPPNSATGGDVLRKIVLRRGQPNTIGWSIHHTGQDWKHRAFVKIDDQVIAFPPAADPSKSEDDDFAEGFETIDVPA